MADLLQKKLRKMQRALNDLQKLIDDQRTGESVRKEAKMLLDAYKVKFSDVQQSISRRV